MAGKIPDKVKFKLKDAGVWKDFLKFRKKLKEAGIEPEEAKQKALEKFLPPAEELDKTRTTPAAIGVSTGAGKGHGTESDPTLVIPDDVLNKPHDIVAAIKYVAKYIKIDDIGNEIIKDAPCAAAVSMLFSYSRNQDRKDKFWDDVHTRLVPSKKDLDQETDETFDGEKIAQLANDIFEKMASYKGDNE